MSLAVMNKTSRYSITATEIVMGIVVPLFFILTGVGLLGWSSLLKTQVAVPEKSPIDQAAPALSLREKQQTEETVRYIPGEIIIKLGSRVSSDSAADILADSGVTAIEPVFPQWERSSREQSQQAVEEAIAAAQQKFPQITARAPHNAPLPDLTGWYVVKVPETADIPELVKKFAKDARLEHVQPNYQMQLFFEPNDPYYHSSNAWGQIHDDLWALKPGKLNLHYAWDVTQGENVTVAVVDTGIDYNHADIAANIWINTYEIPNNGVDDDQNGLIDDVRGWNFMDNTNDPLDRYGHGTHVAGIIAAIGNNNRGITGVAPQAKAMAIKGFNDYGLGSSISIANAVMYGAFNGAAVMNNSWGCFCSSNPLLESAVNAAHGLGGVVVFAAGNYGVDVHRISPQNMRDPKPIVVASSNQLDTVTESAIGLATNIGTLIDIAAPGIGIFRNPPPRYPTENILSLKAAVTAPEFNPVIVGGEYLRMSGTSMAAPHASGVAALILALRPEMTNEQIRHALRLSSDDIVDPDIDVPSGTGRLNGFSALTIESINVTSRISTPSDREEISQDKTPLVSIRGTAMGTGFEQYQLSYRSLTPPSPWQNIGEPVRTPVTENTLGTWALQNNPDGRYLLRVTTASREGLEYEDAIQVYVRRVPPLLVSREENIQWSADINTSGRVVMEHVVTSSRDHDIYTYTDEEGVQPLVVHPTLQTHPRMSDNIVVWTDDRPGEGQGLNLYAYNLNTGRQEALTTDFRVFPWSHAISGEKVVWFQRQNPDSEIVAVYVYDLTTQQGRELTAYSLTTQTSGPPDIDQDRVVWAEQRSGRQHIYLYDLSTNTEQRITSNNAVMPAFPRISGDNIVWIDNTPGNTYADIYLYDIRTGTERRITPSDARIYTTLNILDRPLEIDGNRVVFNDFRYVNSSGNTADVYLYNITTGTETPLTLHPDNQIYPVIAGNYVVWEHADGLVSVDEIHSNWDAYRVLIGN
jgi:beta propeller repeat protein